MTTIGDLGEFPFIDRIAKTLGAHPDLVLGAGDDCAIVCIGGEECAISIDLAVETVHFRPDADPNNVGWKTMTAALSDIAAMGAQPRFALVSVASPPDRSLDYLDKFYAGLNAAAAKHDAVIIGGDTTRAPEHLCIDICVIGAANRQRLLTRGGAQSGDFLAITGWPGRSRAGLDCIERGLDHPALVEAHHRPEARIAEARWLGQHEGVRAMMDVSDGLAQDAGHLAAASALGIGMTSASIAIDPELVGYCTDTGDSIPDIVFAGGEDYELLFAFDPELAGTLLPEFRTKFNIPAHIVGIYDASFDGVQIDGHPPAQRGYNHFPKT